MKALEIYFWEPCVSPHKSGFFAALKKHPAIGEVFYIAQSEMHTERQNLGWQDDSKFPAENIIVAPSPEKVREIIERSAPDSIHIFSGIHWVPCIVTGLREVVRQKRRFGIMSEPRDADGWKGCVRLAHSWLTEGHVRRNADFILAIGRHGPGWFRRAGYKKRNIFPFAYFCETGGGWSAKRKGDGRPAIAFVGRMTEAKGYRLFADSLKQLRSGTRVVTVGGGPESEYLRTVNRQDIEIQDRGVMKMPDIHGLMQEIDILVVPSLTKMDGWAMVISEALLNGAAVLGSWQAGGSICLDLPENGAVLRRLSPGHLSEKLNDMLADENLISQESREARRQWALARLTSGAGAEYLLAILACLYCQAPRPEPYYV